MLNLYKNIKARRIALGMSQDELAQKTGYKDRTSISKIEAGKVDLTQSKVKAFANALETTTSELMGDTVPEGRAGRDAALAEFFDAIAPFLKKAGEKGLRPIEFYKSESGELSINFRFDTFSPEDAEKVKKAAAKLEGITGLPIKSYESVDISSGSPQPNPEKSSEQNNSEDAKK